MTNMHALIGLDHGDRILYDAIDLHVAEMLSTGKSGWRVV